MVHIPETGPANPYSSPPEIEPLTPALESASPQGLPHPGFWGALGMTVLLAVAINIPVLFAGIVLFALGFGSDELERLLIPLVTFTTFSCSVLVAGLWFGRRISTGLALRWPSAWHLAFALLLVAPVAILAQETAAWAAEYLPTFNAETYSSFAEQPLLLVILAGCLLPGVGEEILFRGVLGRGLVARLGPVVGVAWCSFLFALIHLDPAQMCGVFVIGVVLHLALLASGSLLIPIGIHALNNALAFASTRAGYLADYDHVPLALVGAAAATLLPLAMLMYGTRTRWQLPDGAIWNPGYRTAESPPRELQARAIVARPSLVWLLALVVSYGLFVAAAVAYV